MQAPEYDRWTIGRFIRQWERLELDPEYQRSPVWKPQRRKRLVGSLLYGFPIPSIYLRRLRNGHDEDVFEVVDGKQRLLTIYSYVSNEFPLSLETPEYNKKKYCNLTYEEQERIIDSEIPVVILEGTDEEIRQAFMRLQLGMGLNAQEQRNAIKGPVRDFVVRLVGQHPVFSVYREPNPRREHDQTLAKVLLLESSNGTLSLDNANLEKLYRNRYFDPSCKEAKKVIRVLDYMAKAMKDSPPEFNIQGLFVGMYWFISTTMDQYSIKGRESQVGSFFVSLEQERKLEGVIDLDLLEYKEMMRTVKESVPKIQKRNAFLQERFVVAVPDLVLLDNRRVFSEDQRKVIYRRDGEVCQICGDVVEWEDASVDHVVPYSEGGKTSLDNGQLAHRRCNSEKGAVHDQAAAD